MPVLSKGEHEYISHYGNCFFDFGKNFLNNDIGYKIFISYINSNINDYCRDNNIENHIDQIHKYVIAKIENMYE